MAAFDTNSPDLSKEALSVIINAAQNISGKQYTTVRVMGFAPDSTDEEANRALASQRAMVVARELIRNRVDRNKVKIEVFGSQNPRFLSDTPSSKAKNQRVEIIVVSD
jgi:outer membrane protein OmpA-like peptidoglycan-associated protein